MKLFKTTHPFLFCTLIISSILSFFPCLISLIYFEPDNKMIGFIFLIPLIVVFIVCVLAINIFKYFPILSRIVSFLINCFVILFIQLFIGFFIFCYCWGIDEEQKCNQVKHYSKALTAVNSERTKHFPRKIPDNAKNIELKTSYMSFFGSEDIYLKFDTDKSYIDKELKKYKYVNVYINGKCQKTCKYDHRFYNGNINIDGFTFYIINDRENENLPEHHFPYHYGIGVNYDKNQIIYYYEDPD